MAAESNFHLLDLLYTCLALCHRLRNMEALAIDYVCNTMKVELPLLLRGGPQISSDGHFRYPLILDTMSLFHSRMSEWGMNTYLYAPKDDDKHRASWRDLYSLEEVDQLSHLLLQASSRGIIFIYAIAPGLDMTFSSSQEIELLKRKLDQVWLY